jgi:GDP-L-fucose synthase
MKKTNKIYVAGHTGLVGSAIVRRLKREGYKNIISFPHAELDLTDKIETEIMFRLYRPMYVFLAAAKVGGIHDNDIKAGEYFYQNLQIQTNVMEAARKYGAKKLLFLGSSCIYPKIIQQPIKEEYMLSAPLEPTNSAYAMAKLAGIEMCKAYRKQYGCNYISATPTNIYGPGDNFNIPGSHVLPAFIRRFHDAKIGGTSPVEIWGDGTPLREFLHTDDLADALIMLMKEYNMPQHINIGAGYDVPIKFLAKMIGDIVGYEGDIQYNREYPNGTPKKLLDSSRIRCMGWKPTISLETGVKDTYRWFVENYGNIRK